MVSRTSPSKRKGSGAEATQVQFGINFIEVVVVVFVLQFPLLYLFYMTGRHSVIQVPSYDLKITCSYVHVFLLEAQGSDRAISVATVTLAGTG
jgi:hypothetical protein